MWIDEPAAAAHASWCWGGAAVMFGFFRVSSYLTDQRMLQRRGEAYRTVMQEVSALVPWCPRQAVKTTAPRLVEPAAANTDAVAVPSNVVAPAAARDGHAVTQTTEEKKGR